MKRSRLIALAAVAGAVRFVPAAAQTAPKVRVGTIAVESGCEASYAYEQGFFKSAGLDVELVSMPTPTKSSIPNPTSLDVWVAVIGQVFCEA